MDRKDWIIAALALVAAFFSGTTALGLSHAFDTSKHETHQQKLEYYLDPALAALEKHATSGPHVEADARHREQQVVINQHTERIASLESTVARLESKLDLILKRLGP